jgi:hypothetical protein
MRVNLHIVISQSVFGDCSLQLNVSDICMRISTPSGPDSLGVREGQCPTVSHQLKLDYSRLADGTVYTLLWNICAFR